MIKKKYHPENLENKPSNEEACSKLFIKNEKILEIVRKRLVVRDSEKKQHGEVFTPPELVCEMLDRLPKSVWNNKNLKWLDPANGIGNYPLIAYYKLMEGLKKTEPDDKKRSKHIIEEMLFMIELNPINVKLCKKIFKMIDPSATPNIVKANFLTESTKWKKTLGHNNFDIIMGNPPYNEGGTGKGGGVYWKNFVFDGIKYLNKDGFLLYIHPTGWRKPKGERASSGDVWNMFKKYCLYFLKMSDIKMPNFPTVDYYVLQKSEKKCKTHIISEFNGIRNDSKLDISTLEFIPHFLNMHVLSIIKKLFSKKGDRFNIIRNQSFQPKKDDEKKKGIPHTFYYDVKEKKYKLVFKHYSHDKITDYISKSKIIMTYKAGNKKAHLYPVYFSKEMGSTSNTMYQEISKNDNKENIITLLSSDLIHSLLKITQYSEAPNYINEFKILNMIAKPNIGSLKTIEDIYKYYSITKDEKNIINSIIKEKKPAKTKKNKSSLSPSKTKKVSPKKEMHAGKRNKTINKLKKSKKINKTRKRN